MSETNVVKGKQVNGVNVDQLFETIDQLKADSSLAQFKFRATNRWMEGTHCRATVSDFYGAGEEHTSRAPTVFDLDEPPVLLGENRGSNPVEYLLVALSGCLTTSLVVHAAAKGIGIRGVESRYEGDVDLYGFLGISEQATVGYEGIRVYFKIDADLSHEEKAELVQMAKKYSPVYNTITRPPMVSVDLET